MLPVPGDKGEACSVGVQILRARSTSKPSSYVPVHAPVQRMGLAVTTVAVPQLLAVIHPSEEMKARLLEPLAINTAG